MNTIDQRILIPTPPTVVWEYISDLKNNPGWQADCRALSFLTSKQTGPGTRFRYTTDKGRECVVEITAWYEGLGYQYTFVDGVPYKESTGRIRLQEIPEGTVVQWTFSYEMGGVLSGVRGSLGTGRQIEAVMVGSLKTLWKQVNGSGAAQKMREAKSLMRDAPDAEARAQYKPRHPVAVDLKKMDEGQPSPAAPLQPAATIAPTVPLRPASSLPPTAPLRPAAVIPEPPITDDDTKPRPSLKTPRHTINDLIEETEEPEFLADMSRFAPPPEAMPDTQPIKPVSVDALPGTVSPTTPEVEPEPATADTLDFAFEDTIRSSVVTFDAPAVEAQPEAVDDVGEIDFGFEDTIKRDSPLRETLDEAEVEADAPHDSYMDVLFDAPQELASPPEVAAVEMIEPDNVPAEAAEVETPPPLQVASQEVTRELQKETLDEPAINANKAATLNMSPANVPAPEEISRMETASLSIWDIFGVQRPSETEQMRAITDADIAAAEAKEAAVVNEASSALESAEIEEFTVEEPEVTSIVSIDPLAELLLPQRVGMRVLLRRKVVKLRRPV
jgi:uncharacterized protein YndB with AHSA1/START domain